MATRFTKSNLIAELEEINNELKAAGSNVTFRYDQRSGGHAVDIYFGDKNARNMDCMELPRKLAERARDEMEYYLKEQQRINNAA